MSEPDSTNPDAQGPEGEAPEGAEALLPADQITPDARQMADNCFERAKQATIRNNFDYAIHLYLEGLRYNPLDIEKGHRGLRDCALRRRNQGKGGGLGALFGQAKGAFAQMLGRHKDQMLALEAALARDPRNVTLMMQLMQVARRLDYTDVALWFGEIAAEETLRSKKPQKQVFTTLADLYEQRERFQDAVDALSQAVKIDPSDRSLDKHARDLSARASIDKGKLEEVGDFHDMIRDRAQASASATQKVVRTREQLDALFEKLKANLEEDPQNPIKMEALADCEARRGHIDEAMQVLQQALEQTKEYRYKMRQDDIRMAEFRRTLREINEQLEAEPDRQDVKAKRQQVIAKRDEFELAIYQERQAQYPTDMGIRFELGMRQFRQKSHDEAIVSFQTTTRDPKRRIQSLNMLGKCFFDKKLHREAEGQFESAIKQYELSDDPLGKELRYNLARTFEIQDKNDEAIEWYSVIVQQDYQYQDVAKRLEELRRQQKERKTAEGGEADTSAE
ncbi:MAG: tetratricopeptide repeat protein [Planctomycetes bacterium]|nr:tetratricopeptide repeat protein [Planctomycetota bacterium]